MLSWFPTNLLLKVDFGSNGIGEPDYQGTRQLSTKGHRQGRDSRAQLSRVRKIKKAGKV